ncbi:Pyroglutamyl-peptidase 1 [Tieghemiomyces parasiticus]|uniref:Pyroglutamyl-peptidase 1 n=1 Tax=Tieghemiomyces parasiticus TaxID=78921 RepID=A0A9W8E165_9FUNG|nr:Pyroglutamyl-peptidase 1 [Tieghemiomyces parasiticus]
MTEPIPVKCMLITGFEPFGEPRPPTNPSWQAVKDLQGRVLDITPLDGPPFRLRLYVRELPVEYAAILAIIPELHRARPEGSGGYDYYLHVGQGSPGGAKVETRARRHGYHKRDNRGTLLPDGQVPDLPGVPSDIPALLTTRVDTQQLAQVLAHRMDPPFVQSSMDAGLYLCEFTYYVSMACSWTQDPTQVGPNNVLFLHIPQEGQPFSLAQSQQLVLECATWLGQHANQAVADNGT